MGKSLIIRGADFSANAILTDDTALYNSLSDTFEVGYGIKQILIPTEHLEKSENSNRCCIFDFDLSEYSAKGYSHLKIVIKNHTLYDSILGIGSTTDYKIYSEDGSVTPWKWQTQRESLEGDFYGNNHLFINLSKHDQTDFVTTIVMSDIIDYVVLT